MKAWILKSLFPAAAGLILTAAVSCRKHQPEEPLPTGRVRLQLTDAQTKLDGIVYERDEKPVSGWAFFLFEHRTGSLAFRGTVNTGTQVEKTLPTGYYDVYAIGNYPVSGPYGVNMAAIQTQTQFLSLKAGLADNAPGAFVMAASGSIFVEKRADDQAPQEVLLRMKRLVSKVTVTAVKRAFTSPSLAGKSVTLKHIYLTNVYGEAQYGNDLEVSGLSGSKACWYNAMGWHAEGARTPSAAADLLTGQRNLNLDLPQGVSRNLAVGLYFYPNPVSPYEDSHDQTWTGPRCTRLVLETQVDGKTYYYQATLPPDEAHAPLVRNTAFTVSCTLTQLGSTDPEQEIPGLMEVVFGTEPTGSWDSVYSVTEES